MILVRVTFQYPAPMIHSDILRQNPLETGNKIITGAFVIFNIDYVHPKSSGHGWCGTGLQL